MRQFHPKRNAPERNAWDEPLIHKLRAEQSPCTEGSMHNGSLAGKAQRQTSPQNEQSRIVGFPNLGNTCWLAALFRLLATISGMVATFDHFKDQVMQELSATFTYEIYFVSRIVQAVLLLLQVFQAECSEESKMTAAGLDFIAEMRLITTEVSETLYILSSTETHDQPSTESHDKPRTETHDKPSLSQGLAKVQILATMFGSGEQQDPNEALVHMNELLGSLPSHCRNPLPSTDLNFAISGDQLHVEILERSCQDKCKQKHVLFFSEPQSTRGSSSQVLPACSFPIILPNSMVLKGVVARVFPSHYNVYICKNGAWILIDDHRVKDSDLSEVQACTPRILLYELEVGILWMMFEHVCTPTQMTNF